MRAEARVGRAAPLRRPPSPLMGSARGGRRAETHPERARARCVCAPQVVTLEAYDFFEPNEEFGVTAQLDKTEALLTPVLPAAPIALGFVRLFLNEELLILRERESGELYVLQRPPTYTN